VLILYAAGASSDKSYYTKDARLRSAMEATLRDAGAISKNLQFLAVTCGSIFHIELRKIFRLVDEPRT
jgi:anaerobic ribonucleoside-triphosphate reductase